MTLDAGKVIGPWSSPPPLPREKLNDLFLLSLTVTESIYYELSINCRVTSLKDTLKNVPLFVLIWAVHSKQKSDCKSSEKL